MTKQALMLYYNSATIKALACEVAMSSNDLNPSVMKEMFEKEEVSYDYKGFTDFISANL